MLNIREHHYRNVIVWNRRAQFPERKHKSQVPKVTHIYLHWSRRGIGMTPEVMTGVWCALYAMTRKVPKLRISSSSVASWRLRKGELVGLTVTLHGDDAMDFRDTVVNTVLPQMRPFEGYSIHTIDKAGNCTLPRPNPLLFPALQPHYERYRPRAHRGGLSMTIHTNAAAAGGTKNQILARSLSMLTGLSRPLKHGLK